MREQTIKTICNELLKETNVFVFDVFDETITQKKRNCNCFYKWFKYENDYNQ